jgi:hypothetical protein
MRGVEGDMRGVKLVILFLPQTAVLQPTRKMGSCFRHQQQRIKIIDTAAAYLRRHSSSSRDSD